MRNLISGMFLAFSIVSYAQKEIRTFDIFHKGKNVGKLIAEKVINDDITDYSSRTEIELHILTKINVVYDYEVSYLNERLQKGTVVVTIHRKEKTNVKTEGMNNNYNYYSDGKKLREFKKEITNSVVKLFFDEPIGIKEIYAEETGEFQKIEKETDLYVKTAKSGHKNQYYYKDGNLEKVEVKGGIVEFSMVKK
ncbi:DUF6134 family protein [Urechidicola vernalis]|uniref:DUF6134 family protein n=1 Tax=Urechidicola vernalis TaxID=3075600 RepID=A0ABU2Y1F3_9FLAO|nr:DUF6134 family protein [Urechidicola sp. P050]MDT0551636.1 DUF6134 family protein [Urechidicola sp. P050]